MKTSVGKTMILRGRLFAESPIYRGNARKTLFTRDGDGTQRLVSLAGEISGTAQALMDAFLGESRDGKNIGLLQQLWLRLYGSPMPTGLVTKVECSLRDESYPRDRFFDLRMGIRLDEDRWAAEANANYKMETLFRHSVFDFAMSIDEALLQKEDNATRLYHILQELSEGRFWFGAGKSRGLGHCRLEVAEMPFSVASAAPRLQPTTNHLRLSLTFNATNPVLVGWNWGKVDPTIPSFAAIEGRLLVGAMKDLPDPIRKRLEMAIGGPILSPEDWKKKFAQYLPRTIAIWLMERSTGEAESWTLPAAAVAKLGKGKYPLARQALDNLQPLCDKPFPSRDAIEAAVIQALGEKAHMVKRVLEVAEQKRQARQQLDAAAWVEVAQSLGLDLALQDRLAAQIQNEAALTEVLTPTCEKILPRLYQQVDHQVTLLQSDAWVDEELAAREGHLQIKTLLLEGKISESQWGNRNQPPEGVSPSVWRSFLDEHSRVRFQHMLHPANLRKSIANDRNFIAFLKSHRERARQTLVQPALIDFRAGGPFNREISKKYGKPYDTVFMRMLSWTPAGQEAGGWEIYIPGSTIKGAFRKRASQVLKTLWGESAQTNAVLNRLFGAQRQRGLVFFSDAYLSSAPGAERAWCSMDGVKMDPKTGQPIETAKRDYLFAYGEQLTFQMHLDVQDIAEADLEAISLLVHLLQDFQRGDIPLGGEKTCGFGWAKAAIVKLDWLTASPEGISEKLFGKQSFRQEGIWQKLELEGEAAANALQFISPLAPADAKAVPVVPKSSQGFVSHRAFGGYCGTLAVAAEVLTPIHIKESGEPSFVATLAEGPVNGWDFFALAAPEAALRDSPKTYALPSRSIKGVLRHIYAIASDSKEPSPDISHLNPADSLFGWVGTGPNQALMGRLVFDFGLFEQPTLAWFQVPYPYGRWRYIGGEWEKASEGLATKWLIDKTWRLFPHAPLAPLVKPLDDFQPDTVQASYFRAILPGARARLTIRFWNLSEEELQRLIWCVNLEPGLAHKFGNHRYLGFGSVRLTILPESFLINWADRYAARKPEPAPAWRLPIAVTEWLKGAPRVVAHYAELQRALDAKRL